MKHKLSSILLPILSGVLLLVLWQYGVINRVLHVAVYQLPLPSTILKTIAENGETLFFYSIYTLAEALIGIAIGSLIGILMAVVATVFPKWGYGGLIVITAVNAIPIIALAPIMNLWFGDGIGSRAAVVVITTMAAMALNSYRGFNELPEYSLDLMKSYAVSPWVVFRCLRIPNSLPYVLTALKINTTVGMIGAIVSEFFYSSQGLGYWLSNSIKIAKMPIGWSCIFVAAFIGILLYSMIALIEKRALSWHVSQQI